MMGTSSGIKSEGEATTTQEYLYIQLWLTLFLLLLFVL